MPVNPDFFCVNESVDLDVPVFDRGLAFGDGVFETMRVEHGKIPLWDYHRERLLKGLSALQIEVPLQRLKRNFELQQNAFRTMAASVQAPVQGVSKLIVTRGSSNTGYHSPGLIEPNIALTFTAKAFTAKTYATNAAEHLYRSDVAVYENPRVAGIKHLSRLENVLARQEAHDAGYSDGVLSCGNGEILETTNSNLFFETCSGALVTPSLDNAGVNGVMKRLIIETIAPQLGVQVIERAVQWDQLDDFVAAFKTNAISGATPVASIAYRRFALGGLTQLIAERITNVFSTGSSTAQQEYFEIE